ncbi:MAG: hypothetical protein WCV79_00885 [Candidatus Paceibacterota bacterium]
MITSLLISFIMEAMSWAMSFLPKVTSLPLGLDSTITTIFGYYRAMSTIFPFLGTAMTYMLAGVGIELGYKTYQLVNWVINKLRGSG